MKKAMLALAVLFMISVLTAAISFAVCGGELITSAVKYGISEYREYRAGTGGSVAAIIEMPDEFVQFYK